MSARGLARSRRGSRPRRILALAALAPCLLALGCAGGLPPTHYYTLGPPAPGAAAGPVRGGGAGVAAIPAEVAAEGLTVGVETFRVDPPYDQDRIVFRRGADSPEVGFYAYHRWAAPLGRLVAVAVAEGLHGTPGIASVEPADSNGAYGARLAGRVLSLEEVDLPEGPEARLALALELTDGDGGVVWSGTVRESAGGPAASPSEVVRLMARALSKALERLRAELAAALGG